jgi:hypothetical protein
MRTAFPPSLNKQAKFLASLLSCSFLFAACGQAHKVPWIGGTWMVIGYQAPGISAMGRDEASGWIGKVAEYTNTQASFDGNQCASPAYQAHAMRSDEFYSEFRVAPESLGKGPINLIEVYCGGSAWVNPGGKLVRIGEDRLFLFWDGVFFQLQQQEDKEQRRK